MHILHFCTAVYASPVHARFAFCCAAQGFPPKNTKTACRRFSCLWWAVQDFARIKACFRLAEKHRYPQTALTFAADLRKQVRRSVNLTKFKSHALHAASLREALYGPPQTRKPRKRGFQSFVVGGTRFELVASSVSGKRSPPELTALRSSSRLYFYFNIIFISNIYWSN